LLIPSKSMDVCSHMARLVLAMAASAQHKCSE
jgi:hypothetical protein